MNMRRNQIIIHVILIAASIFFTLPLAWLSWSSLKSAIELFSNPWPPLYPKFYNFVRAFFMMNYLRAVVNSIIITVAVVAVTLLVSTLIAYPLALYEFKGKMFLYMFIMSGILVPSQVTFIPLFIELKALGLINTLVGVILPQIANGIPLAVLIFVSFFKDVLRDIIEAARLDGSSELNVLWQIVIPVSKPAFVFVGIFKGILAWSEFIIPLITLYDENLYPLTLSMQVFRQKYAGVYWPEMFAGLTLNVLPMLIIYALFSTKFIQGITMGAVKG